MQPLASQLGSHVADDDVAAFNNFASARPRAMATKKQPSWLSNLFGQRPENRFTVANFSRLYNELSRTTVVNDRNKEMVVESLRTISELIIWGEKNDPAVFEFFLEKNVLGIFWRILAQERTPVTVKQQLLQTLSILIQNIETGPSVYFILSNNHINELISHPFDLSNEELLAHYVTLLKAIALRLDKDTVQFFIGEPAAANGASSDGANTDGADAGAASSSNAAAPPPPAFVPPAAFAPPPAFAPPATATAEPHATTAACKPAPSPRPACTRFALFDEAMKLWTNEERMVRTAVRTIVLSICRVDEPEVRAYISRSPMLPKQLNASLHMDTHALLGTIRNAGGAASAAATAAAATAAVPSALTGSTLGVMEGALQQLLDEIYFINDLLEIGVCVARTLSIQPHCRCRR